MMVISSSAKDRFLKAGEADEIASILQEACDQLTSNQSEFDILPDIRRSALRATYRKDVDSLATRRLERRIIDLTAASAWPVTEDEVTRNRTEARQRLVLNPLAARHHRLCKTARQPSDLLSIVEDVTSGRIPEVDERFRETAVELAFRRALALSPDDPVTEELGQLVDGLRAKSTYWSQFGISGSYAQAVRNHEDGLRQRREAAARKRGTKKTGTATT
jgi:hypothetical protein